MTLPQRITFDKHGEVTLPVLNELFHAGCYLIFLFRDFLLTCHENRHLKGKTFEDVSDHSGSRN